MKTTKLILIFTLSLFLSQTSFSSNYNCTANTENVALCGTGQLSLILHFDNSPEDLNWQIKDSNNAVYASGYNYPVTNAGQTITETIPTLPDGDYALVIFDAGSDGLCCNNGNGYYELLDGTNAVIATGSNYIHSDISTFCYNTSNNDVFDLQAPTDPVIISATNITTTSVDINWTASSDNVGIWAYGLIIDGVYADLTNMTTYHIWYLQPGTTYDITILARDDIGNFSNFSNTFTFTTQTSTPVTIDEQVSASYFESGWDNWQDGGSDCFRYSGNKSAEGSYSIRIRDDSGNKSSMSSANMDLSAYDSIRVDFEYFHRGYENGEDFFLRLFENGSYTTVKSYVRGTDFTSNGFYSGSVLMKATDYNFSTSNKIRFQSDASNNNDRIFIDAVVVTGYYQGSSARIKQHKSDIHDFLLHGAPLVSSNNTIEESLNPITLYPNPAEDFIMLKGINMNDISNVKIYTTNGDQILINSLQSNGIDVSLLNVGVYFLTFQDEKGNLRKIRFLKN